MPPGVPGRNVRGGSRMKVYEAIAETLSRLGVDTTFGLVGSGNFGLIHHMTRHCGMAYHAAGHEAAAVAMADGYARVSGKLGVCTVHQGPGVTNTLTALTEAVKAGTPMLLLAGDIATTALYQNLDVDQDAVAGSVGAGTAGIRSANTAVEDITRAARRAKIERRPIAVSLPIDIQEQDCEAKEPPTFVEQEIAAPRPSEEAVSRVADLLDSSSRPAIIAGRGAVLAVARPQLEALGDRIGALFATSMMAKGFFAGDPFDLGISGGFIGHLRRHFPGSRGRHLLRCHQGWVARVGGRVARTRPGAPASRLHLRQVEREISPVLYNRDLLLIYIAAIAILWNLWFIGFWSVSIIGDAAQSSFLQAALTAAINAGAGILGFPAGGGLADDAKRRGRGRKPMLVSFTLIQGLLTLAFGFYIMNGGQSVLVLGALLFTASLFFNALQPMSQALTADLVPSAAYLGAAFGLWNLIGEMGAVLSPAISGTLRDATGNWTAAVMLDAGIILASFVLLLFVREPREEVEAPAPTGA